MKHLASNKYLIIVSTFLVLMTIYTLSKVTPENRVYLRCYFYFLIYGLIFSFSLLQLNSIKKEYKSRLKMSLNRVECNKLRNRYNFDKLYISIISFYSLGMFIFNLILRNKDLPTFINICNSESASIIASFGMVCLALIVWLINLNKNV